MIINITDHVVQYIVQQYSYLLKEYNVHYINEEIDAFWRVDFYSNSKNLMYTFKVYCVQRLNCTDHGTFENYFETEIISIQRFKPKKKDLNPTKGK